MFALLAQAARPALKQACVVDLRPDGVVKNIELWTSLRYLEDLDLCLGLGIESCLRLQAAGVVVFQHLVLASERVCFAQCFRGGSGIRQKEGGRKKKERW